MVDTSYNLTKLEPYETLENTLDILEMPDFLDTLDKLEATQDRLNTPDILDVPNILDTPEPAENVSADKPGPKRMASIRQSLLS